MRIREILEDPVFYFFLVLVLLFLFPLVFSIGASDGYHTGIVTAVEHNSNILFATNLVYFKTDGSSTQEDKYCVNNLILKKQLEQISKEKKQVTIHYSNSFIMPVWKCNGGESIIVGVE